MRRFLLIFVTLLPRFNPFPMLSIPLTPLIHLNFSISPGVHTETCSGSRWCAAPPVYPHRFICHWVLCPVAPPSCNSAI
ncbi:hypothetical protein E2C01_035034 [Portunus trituberculatus]|uniref:Secreted protein n=1 Tax=Portunus trituberculatus TaxID=210409 RepID=A0A5B7F8M8_PORTR|nr:hypothetical protein [Portunus trituberculatus]